VSAKRLFAEFVFCLWWNLYGRWANRWVWGRAFDGTTLMIVRREGRFRPFWFWIRHDDGTEELFVGRE
jgi:hypothetical protein